ncbi:MAG: FHA domain-containing protein [Planctomycetota bacterium]
MTRYVLEILDGDRAGETVPLVEAKVTIGRKATNELPLNDEKVSGQHAEVAFEDGRYVLRDLGSTNGTLLEGRRVDEIALTAADTFQIGRVRLVFREEGAAAAPASVTVHRVDASRLQGARRRGGLGMVAAIVVLAGAGAWFWFQGRGAGGGGGGGGRRVVAVTPVPGNVLPQAAASCEDVEVWDLRAGGLGFELGLPPRSGETALACARFDEDTQGFALARLSKPIPVMSGEALRLQGHVREAGGGRVSLRLRFTSTLEASEPLWAAAVAGAAGGEDYVEVSTETAVPGGMDQVELEVLAQLPAAGAEVWIDDLALLKGGSAPRMDLSIGGCSLIGTGGGVALWAGETPVLLGISPRAAAAPAGDAAAALLTFADVGATVSATAAAETFHVEIAGGPGGAVLRFPLESASAGVRARGAADAPFAVQSGPVTLSGGAGELLLGSGSARVLLRAPGATAMRGGPSAVAYEVTLEGTDVFDLRTAFGAERSAARDRVRDARAQREAGAPGAALDLLATTIDTSPHDDAALAEAELLRGEILRELQEGLDHQRAELAKAEFFGAASAFRRIRDAVDALVRQHGAHIPEPEATQALRDRADALLAERRGRDQEQQRAALESLAGAFKDSGEQDLHALVQDYVARHLNR